MAITILQTLRRHAAAVYNELSIKVEESLKDMIFENVAYRKFLEKHELLADFEEWLTYLRFQEDYEKKND